MNKSKAKILMLVEGEKTDFVLMQRLLDIYGVNEKHEIVSYNTNIYVLYNHMFAGGDPDSLDLLQVLKEHEKDPLKKKIFEVRYSDILLIFDLDPQDRLYSSQKVQQMLAYFNESSENGKLYINYPMVEAFYHMKSIPDPEYYTYTASLQELKDKLYKARVQKENRNHDYSKFARTREECNVIIRQNIEKAWRITGNNPTDYSIPVFTDILKAQVDKILKEGLVFVLCTCAFYIFDYNSTLIRDEGLR